jgi:phospholipase C
MKGFLTPTQLPVINQLATEFAICDHWFSSLPGPTWPNRFFVHGASSSGLDYSPSFKQIKRWESAHGFRYRNGSVFNRLFQHKHSYRLFIDTEGPLLGDIPQVSSIKGIQIWDVEGLPKFFDLLNPEKGKSYDASYTFIEPNYGDIISNTFKGGSSQHPEDSMKRGEALIKSVYEAIRNSAIWESSMLIITYDEHGGFYDSVGPGAATPPGDSPDYGLNEHGFKFDRYGVRVPAVVISPYIQKGAVDHTIYDHASVPATLERLLHMKPMTDRDRTANDVLRLLTLPKPRTDCPTKLHEPVQVAERPRVALSTAEQAQMDDQPIPESGNFVGFLEVMLKAELELGHSSKASIKENFLKIKTMKDARAYFERMHQLIEEARTKP